MKIENGELIHPSSDDVQFWVRTKTGTSDLTIMDAVDISREEAATLARYLLRFAETGELREPDAIDSAKAHADELWTEGEPERMQKAYNSGFVAGAAGRGVPPTTGEERELRPPKADCADAYRCSRQQGSCMGAAEHCFVAHPACGSPKPKREPHSCEGCVAMQNATGNDAEQQLARETLAFWERATLATISHWRLGYRTVMTSSSVEHADGLTRSYLKARQRYGVK